MNKVEMSDICEHIGSGSYPFHVDLVMDDHLGLTEGIVHCRHCQRAYLLEMLDWVGNDRVFRISSLADDQARGLLRNLQRGSCDLQRAGAEVQHLKTASAFAPYLLLVDMSVPRIEHVAALAPEIPAEVLPSASWRELPCDGWWLNRLRTSQAAGASLSNTAIVKG